MPKSRDVVVAYLLWLLGGIYGLHRFYLGDKKYALLLMFTLGGLGILMLADLVLLPTATKHSNAKILAGKKFPSKGGMFLYFLIGIVVAGYGMEKVTRMLAPQYSFSGQFEKVKLYLEQR